MAKSNFTNLYVSVPNAYDIFIDNYRLELIKSEKKHYTKTQVLQKLIELGMSVVDGKYLKLDPSIDEFVSQMQNLIINMNGERVVIKKSKEQVYHMIIEKGLKHLGD